MSSLNFLWFKKKKTEEPITAPYSGFIFDENQNHDSYDSVFHCLVKGLIIFCATIGCVHGVLSEFEIEYNFLLVGFIIFLASMALSLMHIKKWIFNVGYPVLFVIFTSGLIQYRAFANSGFQAFLNIFNETYSAHFLLNFSRESTEIITNRYMTITAMAVFVGVFIAILINVGIFNDMYFLTIFDFTFWPLQLGIYIGKYPSYISLVFVFFAFFATCFLKLSGHYHFVYPEKKKKYHFNYVNQNKDYVFHKSNARNMAHLSLFALVIALFFSLFGSLSVGTSETEAIRSGKLKSRMDESVKILVQSGIMGMFNRYDSAGGISNGKLGGVRSVRPDYETDLIATFVPYAYERMYLKAYVGATYTSTEWLKPSEENGYIYSDINHEDAAFTESNTLSEIMETGFTPKMKGKMLIENVDASINNLYMPYYTSKTPKFGKITPENTINGALAIGNTVEVEYTPYSASRSDLQEFDENAFNSFKTSAEQHTSIAYKTEAYNNYLAIPGSIQEDLEKYKSIIGTGTDTMDQIARVRHFLYSCYEYDMSPGATPYNKDYVTYFLDTQKRGYCAHFASAGTLLLRMYGIPARYVEGYVIDQINISESGKATDYKYDDFFSGDNLLGSANVVEVEISDGNAHAWTEVYIDGFGWIPVEMTPPSDESEEVTYNEFLAALSGLFNNNNSETEPEQITLPETEYNSILLSLHIGSSPVFITFIIVILLLILIPAISYWYNQYLAWKKRNEDYNNGKYDSSIAYQYIRLLRKLKHTYPAATIVLPEDAAKIFKYTIENAQDKKVVKNLRAFEEQNHIDMDTCIALTQKSHFAASTITKAEADLLIAYYKLAYQAVVK